MLENEALTIERSVPQRERHPLANVSVMVEVTENMAPKQEMVPLVDYLRDIAGKPRGSATGGREDLNSHNEEFIVKDAEGIRIASLPELQSLLSGQGLDVEVLGVQSIGNPKSKSNSGCPGG